MKIPSSRRDRNTFEPLVGAHESIAGGINLAFDRAHRVGCTALQIFTKNNTQWKSRPLADDAIASYKTAARESNIRIVLAHGCYLINLAAVNKETLRKSREALADELTRCEQLGIRGLIVHPGAHMGAGEIDGLKRIAESINLVHEQTQGYVTRTILETTAGQGTSLGYRFEQLRLLLDAIEQRERMGICLDTCHVFAAGYELRSPQGYETTFGDFDRIIGREWLTAIHANDSKKDLGSRVDRHEHIGKGCIGKSGFRLLMNDSGLAAIPKIIETPKGEDLREDRINLSILKKLIRDPLS